jgi:glycosyltransferase involved in cell wall biosynthesis
LLQQDYEDFELVISDNASTDATELICRQYASKDTRIQYHRNAVNMGMVNNFNRVFTLSSGEYFMWAAHDDIWEPSFVSRCVEVLQNNPSVVLCYPQTKFIGPDGEKLELSFPTFDSRGIVDLVSRFHTHIWGITYPYPIEGLIDSSALERTSLCKDQFGFDLILLAELSLLGRFAYIPTLLFYNRLPCLVRNHGDWLDHWDLITKKVDKPVTTKWAALRWYWQMVYGHMQVVNKHVSDFRAKAILISSVLYCVLVKYHFLLKTLLELSERKQDKN